MSIKEVSNFFRKKIASLSIICFRIYKVERTYMHTANLKKSIHILITLSKWEKFYIEDKRFP